MKEITNSEKNLFQTIFMQSSLGLVAVDEKGLIVFSNLFASKMFGYSYEEFLNIPLSQLIPLRFKERHGSHFNNFIQNSSSRVMGKGLDLVAIRKDGVEFPVEISLDVHYIDNQKYIVAFVNNISKRVEEKIRDVETNRTLAITINNRTRELSRTLQTLELLNERLESTLISQKAILDNAKVILFSTNQEGLIRFINPETIRLTGYSEAEMVNLMSPAVFFDDKEIEMCREELKNKHGLTVESDLDVILKKSLFNEIENQECSFTHKNGTKFPVSITMTAMLDKKDQLVGFMGVAVDLTERKKAEKNLIEALTKEKKLGELKSRFVTLASHEFRTPLSTISSSAFLIEKYKETADDAKRKKHLDRILSAVNNLSNILNDFLNVGKIEEGKVDIQKSRFSIPIFMQKLAVEINPLLKPGQTIHYEHTGDEEFELDPSIFKNIMINLISNAIKYSNNSCAIEIETITNEHNFQVEVKDHGIGIPEEDQEHLMERFFRGKNVMNIPGTGLGLHIVSKYVERMNGDISFVSKLNEGTKFTLIFKR
jgi:PAS domain S-box-containing protein